MATQFCIATGTVALVAGTLKTLIEMPSGSTMGITVIGLEVSFNHTAASSCVLEWNTFGTTGTGVTITPIKYGTGQGVAMISGTIKVANSAPATTLAAAGLPSWVIPLPGMYSILYPAGREFFQPASVNRCLNATAVAAGNVRVNLYVEQ